MSRPRARTTATSQDARGFARGLLASSLVHGALASLALALPIALLQGRAPREALHLAEVRVTPRAEPEPVPEAEPIHEVREVRELPEPELRPVEVPDAPWPDERRLETYELVPPRFERLPLEPLERQRPEAEPLAPEPEPEPEPPSPPLEQPEPLGADGVSMAPVLIPELSPRPPYPRQALRLGWQGVVICRISVGRDGRVRGASVEASSGRPLLDAAAREGVLAWRFRPALEDGEPVERDVLMRVVFDLAGRARR